MKNPVTKMFVVVRHGEDEQTNSLTPRGCEDVLKLADAIEKKIKGIGGKVALLTSPTRRAVETAEIISKRLDIEEYQQCGPLFWDDKDHGEEQIEAILEMAGDYDVIIAVAHYNAPMGIVRAFSRRFCKEEFWCRKVPKSCGVSISRSGAVDYLPRPRDL